MGLLLLLLLVCMTIGWRWIMGKGVLVVKLGMSEMVMPWMVVL